VDFYERLKEQPRSFVALGILVTIVGLGLYTGRLPLSPSASADSGHIVSLYVDGQKRLFSSNSGTVGDVLHQAGVTLAEGDLVDPSANTPLPQGPFNINVYRARPVVVVDGTQDFYIHSAYSSPDLLAKAAGLTVYPEDKYNTGIVTDTEVLKYGNVGEQVTIIRAKPISVNVDGSVRSIRTQANTVGEALKDAGISLGLKDTVSVPLSSPIIPGMLVTVTRVTDATVTLTQAIPRTVQTVTDPDVMKGQQVVQTAGSDGQKTVTYEIHYRNGVETSRELLQVVSQTAPVTEVVAIGTKVLFEGSVEYWRPLVEQAAAQWGLDPNVMLRIMQCESNGNAGDVSTFVVLGQHPEGLFQYLPSTWEAAGGTADNIFDGPTQIQITAKKMATEGTGAWACQ
jgi:uncharacterized protein YabE (DUF348 family)